MVVIQDWPMNGSIRTTSLMKHAHLIKQKGMIMVLAVVLKSSVKIVFQVRVAGLKKEQRSMELMSMDKLKEKKI